MDNFKKFVKVAGAVLAVISAVVKVIEEVNK